MKVPATRVDPGPRGGVQERDQVGQVIGMKVGQHDVLDLILLQPESGQPVGDAVAEVEHHAQRAKLDQYGGGDSV